MSWVQINRVFIKNSFSVFGSRTCNCYGASEWWPKVVSYRKGYGLDKPVEYLLKASGVNLRNGGGLEELRQFQEYLSDYKIVVFVGLSPDRLILRGNSPSVKKLYLLYDADFGHYNVITNIKAAVAKRYISNACHTLWQDTQMWHGMLPVYCYTTLY